MKKLMKQKWLLIVTGILLFAAVGGTFAYYYTQVVIPNEFKTQTYNVTLEEEFYNDWGTKQVTIKNEEETNVDVVLRINYNEMWSDTTGDVLSNVVNGENVVTKNWTTEFLNDFEKSDDGWYYYKKVLKAKGSVPILESVFQNTTAILNSPDAHLYNAYDYRLVFNFEAIQANEKAVKDIWGKNIIMNGSDITW